MSIKVDKSKNGKIYRCLITNANGDELASEEVMIRVSEVVVNTSAPSVNMSAPAEDVTKAYDQSASESPVTTSAQEAPFELPAPAPDPAPSSPAEDSPEPAVEEVA